MRFEFAFIMIFSFVEYSAFAQPTWFPTNTELTGKTSWTFYKKIDDYPDVEFRMDSTDTENYFDCNYYHFFSDTAFPQISYSDSVRCAQYMDWYWKLRGYAGGPHPEFYSNYLPYIYNQVDTFWIHKLIREKENFQFDSLDYKLLVATLEKDAVFKGRIIAKRYPRDSTICLNFTIAYVIEILDTIHSYFNLKSRDKILVYDEGIGYAKPCKRSKDDNVTIYLFDKSNYETGDTSMFFLDRTYYKFIMRHHKYEDKKIFCPQVLALYDHSDKFMTNYTNDIEKIKLFFNTKYHEK